MTEHEHYYIYEIFESTGEMMVKDSHWMTILTKQFINERRQKELTEFIRNADTKTTYDDVCKFLKQRYNIDVIPAVRSRITWTWKW